MLIRYGLGAVVLLGALLAASTSQAEIYLRGSLVQENARNSSFSDRRCQPGDGLVAYFGCIDGEDGRPLGARGDFGSSTGLELALGRHHDRLWRSELLLAYQPGFDFRGNANFLDSGSNQPVRGDLSQWRGGFNTYLDLAALAGFEEAAFSPWLGAGVAVVRNRVDAMDYAFPALANQPALTRVPGGSHTGIGWMLALGADIRLGQRQVLELALSWSDHGEVRTDAGPIEVVRGGNVVAEVPVGSTRAELQSWGVRLSLRHYFGR
jgi:opacity protein-like surface antigen